MIVEIKNRMKKSFEEINHYFNYETKWTLTMCSGWRQGTVRLQIESLDDLRIDEDCGPEDDNYELDAAVFEGYEFVDSWDGCWTDFRVYHPTATEEEHDEMLEKVEAVWEEDYFTGIEEMGFQDTDYESYFYGPIDIEVIEE